MTQLNADVRRGAAGPPDSGYLHDLAVDWREFAACTGHDPELFFPIGTGQVAASQTVEAKKVCQRCPVLRQCRDTALINGYDGIWGGLDDDERRQLRLAQLTTRRT